MAPVKDTILERLFGVIINQYHNHLPLPLLIYTKNVR